jgi:hypothetical protein
MSRRKRRAHIKARRTNHPEDWNKYLEIQSDSRKEFKKSNKYIKNMLGEEGNTNKRLYS